jgi:hypothetical protein
MTMRSQEMSTPRPGSLCPFRERPSRELGGDLGHVDAARVSSFLPPASTRPVRHHARTGDSRKPRPHRFVATSVHQFLTPPGIPLTSPLSALYPSSAGTPPSLL